jgi:phage gpG-like protein
MTPGVIEPISTLMTGLMDSARRVIAVSIAATALASSDAEAATAAHAAAPRPRKESTSGGIPRASYLHCCSCESLSRVSSGDLLTIEGDLRVSLTVSRRDGSATICTSLGYNRMSGG